jgi:hypothetical protein
VQVSLSRNQTNSSVSPTTTSLTSPLPNQHHVKGVAVESRRKTSAVKAKQCKARGMQPTNLQTNSSNNCQAACQLTTAGLQQKTDNTHISSTQTSECSPDATTRAISKQSQHKDRRIGHCCQCIYHGSSQLHTHPAYTATLTCCCFLQQHRCNPQPLLADFRRNLHSTIANHSPTRILLPACRKSSIRNPYNTYSSCELQNPFHPFTALHKPHKHAQPATYTSWCCWCC